MSNSNAFGVLLVSALVALPVHAGPDLAVLEVEVPPLLLQGRTSEVSAAVANLGVEDAIGFHYRIVLSKSETITLYDHVILEVGPVSLPQGVSTTLTQQIEVPEDIERGWYYLGFILDSERQLSDPNRVNDVLAAPHQSLVSLPAPDLHVRDVQVSESGAAGETIRVDFTAENRGVVAAEFDYGIYASREVANPKSILLFRGRMSLDPDESAWRAQYALLPAELPGGEYLVGVMADPDDELEELDESGNLAQAMAPIQVEEGTLRVSTSWLPEAVVGQDYAARFAAMGGSGGYVFSIVDGELPQGLVFDPTLAEISGVPSAVGNHSFVVEVSSGGSSASAAFVLAVTSRPISLAVNTESLVTAIRGMSYEMSLAAHGGSLPYAWSAEGLPSGIALDSDGFLHGEPAVSGSFGVELCVRDDSEQKDCKDLQLRVVESGDFAILTGPLPPGMVNESYEPQALETIGATGAVSWSLIDGGLPPGMTLAAESGLIRGTPVEAGRFEFRIRARDEAGFSDANDYRIEVSGQRLSILTGELAAAEVGAPYEQALELDSGAGQEPYQWRLFSGLLPAGLVLDEATGGIVGTPETDSEGRHTFGIEVRDAAGSRGMAAFVIEVRSPERDDVLSTQPESPGGCESAGGPGSLLASALLALVVLLLAKRRVAGAGLVLVLLMLPSQAWSQAWTYSAVTLPAPYEEVTGAPLTAINGTWDGNTRITLPFTFDFYGQTYSALTVSVNGLVGFEPFTSGYYGNHAIPNTIAPNGIVAVWWDDLDARPAGAEISVATLGAAPDRVFVVQWKDVARNAGTMLNFQLRLHEGTTMIETRFGPIIGTATASASAGVENQLGEVGLVGLSCTPNCAQADFPSDQAIIYATMPNLEASEAQAPSVLWVGAPVQVGGTVSNTGGVDSGEFDVIAVIASTPDAILEGTEIGRARVAPGLQVGASRALTMTAEVPLGVETDQDYWFSLIPDPDGEAQAAGPGTNFAPPIKVRVEGPIPILQVTSVLPGSAEVALGGELQVDFDLANTGSLGADTAYWIVLSTNDVISGSDVFLHEESVTLLPHSSSSHETTVVIPSDIAAGRYYVGVILDPAGEVMGPDIKGYTKASAEPIAVVGESVVIMTSSLPQARAGRAYRALLQAAGGDGSYRWRVTSGALPTGLSLSEDGWIEGLPQIAADEVLPGPPWAFSFQVLVRSGSTLVAQTGFSITVDDDEMPLQIVTSDLPSGAVGFDYEAQLFAAGGARPYRWTLTADTSAPPGLLVSEDGRLVGIPEEPGTYDLMIEVEDAGGAVDTLNTEVEVKRSGQLNISTTKLPGGLLGQAYAATLEAVGGSAPYTWELDETAALPQGLSLGEDGVIEGVPEEIGAFDVVVTVRDGVGNVKTNMLGLVIGFEEGMAITTQRLPLATAGRQYDASLSILGGTAPYHWSVVTGSLPMGLSLDEGAGLIHGVPGDDDLSRDYPFIVQVEDSSGRSALRALSIFVGPPPPVLESEGCSVSTGGGKSALLLLVVTVLLGGLRRRARQRPGRRAERANRFLGVLLVAGVATVSCGEKNLCEAVDCPAGTLCSEADGECRCGGPGGELCTGDTICDPVSGRCHATTDACAQVSCDGGLTCDPDDGTCRCGGSGGVLCLENEQCDPLRGTCVAPRSDPCADVDCAGEEACDPASGQCRCGVGPGCVVGESCRSGECVHDLCYGAACGGGNLCDPADGRCRCGGAGGQSCTDEEVCDPGLGQCLPAGSCIGVACPMGMSCDPADATCRCGGSGGPVCASDEYCSPLDGLCLGDSCLDIICPQGAMCDPAEGLCRCGGPDGDVCETGERCVEPEGLDPVCSTDCSWLLQDCDDERGCYYEERQDTFFCAEAGASDEGGTCSTSVDCRPGLDCRVEGLSRNCRRMCDVAAGDAEAGACELGSYCEPVVLGSELGICRRDRGLGLGVLPAPDHYDFGGVAVGCSDNHEICIYNTGTTDITVTELAIAPSQESAFALTSVPSGIGSSPGALVSPGASICFVAEFRPNTVGPKEGSVIVTTGEHDQPFEVALEGIGTAEMAVSESFVQGRRSKIDFLLVIDDSGSMEAAQTRLSEHLGPFMLFLADQSIDYHIGVITTDGRDTHSGGVLRPLDRSRPHIITPRTTDPLLVLQQNVMVGTIGDATERGFLSAEKSLHPSFLTDSAKNAGFLRHEAHLVMLFLSDEVEQSQHSTDYYLDVFREVKGFRRLEHFTAYAIVALEGDTCAVGGPFPRYIEMTERSGGAAASICSNDWTDVLSAMASNQNTRFSLAGVPVPGTIQVTVHRAGSDPVATSFWEHDQENNLLVFDAAAIPEPGDVIEVTFQPRCLP